MKKISFTPISGRLVLKKIEKDELSEGGIVIPDAMRDVHGKHEAAWATVVAVGPGMDEHRDLPNGGMECKVGDLVTYPAAQGFSFKIEGEEFMSIYEKFILGIVS